MENGFRKNSGALPGKVGGACRMAALWRGRFGDVVGR